MSIDEIIATAIGFVVMTFAAVLIVYIIVTQLF